MNARKPVPTQRLHPKTAAILIAAVAGIGLVVWWAFFSKPLPAWRVRAEVVRYLKKHGKTSDFAVDFRFPSKAAMSTQGTAGANSASPPTQGAVTKKSFSALSEEYLRLKQQALVLEQEVSRRAPELARQEARLAELGSTASTNAAVLRDSVGKLQKAVADQKETLATKEKQMAPLLSDLWGFQRAWLAQQQAADAAETDELAQAQANLIRSHRTRFEQAQTYSAMYELIGQQLWVANRLFSSANVEHRRSALSLVRQAAWDAVRYPENPWLAARICEGYIVPNLDLADLANRRAPLNLDNLAGECARLFRQVDENPNVVRLYKLVLASASTPQRKDWSRVQLAQVHEQDGQYAQALRYLRQVERTNDFARELRRVPWLQDRVKARR